MEVELERPVLRTQLEDPAKVSCMICWKSKVTWLSVSKLIWLVFFGLFLNLVWAVMLKNKNNNKTKW